MKILIMGSPTSKGYKSFGIDSTVCGGGWVENLINAVSNDIELEIFVMFYADFATDVYYGKYEKVTYIALPIRVKELKSCNPETTEDLKVAYDYVKPDVVHIIGTEREHNLRLAQIAGFENTVFSITGLASVIEKHYLGGIDKSNFMQLSIGDIYRRGGPIKEQKQFAVYGEHEKLLLKNAEYVMGRTTWDYVCVKQINPNVEYIYCSEILNPIFQKNKWDVNKTVRHRIFVSQASYPLKGFHRLLEAFPIILKFYPDSEIVVAGPNILDDSTLMARIKRTTYAKYLLKLIKKLNIPRGKIKYTGSLSADKMLEQYLSANVFVLPSAIENSPNSLGEAMSLGMPCIASCVGGVQDMLRDKVDGFIYPFDEPYMLAHYVCEIFHNDELAIKLGNSAAESAKERFDSVKVKNTTIDVYKRIAKK